MSENQAVTVFCSAQEVDPRFSDPVKELGRLMVENGYDLVWGGSDKGTMKLIASAVQDSGGRIIGISTKMLEQQKRDNADEMIVTADLTERMNLLLERGDAVVVCPGGIGSWAELFHILELKKHGQHHKPVIIFNIDNYYRGLKQQLEDAEQQGFLPLPAAELVFIADTPQQIIDYLKLKISPK